LQEVEAPRSFVQSVHESGKVTPTHRLPLPPRKYSWYSFLLEAESTPGPQCGRKGYVNEKPPIIPSGIEPVTFRLVAKQRKHVAYIIKYDKVVVDGN
jgi:hypothetical protein